MAAASINRDKPIPQPAGVVDYGFDGWAAQAQRWNVLEGQHTPSHLLPTGDADFATGPVTSSGQSEYVSHATMYARAIPTQTPEFDIETDQGLAYASNFDDWQSVASGQTTTTTVTSEPAWNRFLRALRGA